MTVRSSDDEARGRSSLSCPRSSALHPPDWASIDALGVVHKGIDKGFRGEEARRIVSSIGLKIFRETQVIARLLFGGIEMTS